MSSHHFVKEDQEPALIIMNAAAITFGKVQELLEWSPTVIVSEEALSMVLGWGIKIDVILCKEANLNSFKVSLVEQTPLRFISFQHNSDALSSAIHFLVTANYKAVNILVNDLVQLEWMQSLEGIDVEVFCDHQRWTYSKSGIFEKWLSAGMQLFTYPVANVEVVNLNSQLKCMRDGMVRIERLQPLWVGEELA